MDRLSVSTVAPRQYQGAGKQGPCRPKKRKQTSEPLKEWDIEGSTFTAIEQLPLAVLTDAFLATTPGTDASREAMENILAASK